MSIVLPYRAPRVRITAIVERPDAPRPEVTEADVTDGSVAIALTASPVFIEVLSSK